MRSSILFLGALLARCGEAYIPMPGGCELGPRPIDLHLQFLRELGAEICLEQETLHGRLPRGCGGTVRLPFPSVGTTENLLLAAVGCDRPVTIQNAAREPEIVDLARFLQRAGMEITGAGTDCISICRKHSPHGAAFSVLPDRIEAATYLCAAAATRGKVTLRSVDPLLLEPVTEALCRAGCAIRCGADWISLCCSALQSAGAIATAPYPGFPTDAQPPLLAAMTTAEGTTRFVETVFSGRYHHTAALRQMGAVIRQEGRTAEVCGVPKLHGTAVRAKDLRGGAALLIAGLCAEGETTLDGLQHLRRGYAGLEQNFKNLGADIKLLEIL